MRADITEPCQQKPSPSDRATTSRQRRRGQLLSPGVRGFAQPEALSAVYKSSKCPTSPVLLCWAGLHFPMFPLIRTHWRTPEGSMTSVPPPAQQGGAMNSFISTAYYMAPIEGSGQPRTE